MTPAGIEPVIFWFVAQHLNHCATVVPDDVMGSYIFYPGHLTAGGHLVAIEQGGSLGPICKKLKCTLVQALRLCTGRTTHTGSRGIALLFLDHASRRGWGVSVTPRQITLGKDPVPIVQEAGWAQGPVWTGAENFAPPTGIRSPDRPARSQSLYRLRYLAHIP